MLFHNIYNLEDSAGEMVSFQVITSAILRYKRIILTF